LRVNVRVAGLIFHDRRGHCIAGDDLADGLRKAPEYELVVLHAGGVILEDPDIHPAANSSTKVKDGKMAE